MSAARPSEAASAPANPGLARAGENSKNWRDNTLDTLVLILILALGASATWYATKTIEAAQTRQKQDQLNAIGQSVVDSFYLDLVRSIEAIRAVGQLVANHPQLSRSEFSDFSEAMMAAAPTLSSLQWQPTVSAQALASFEAKAQSQGLIGFRVLELEGSLANERTVPVQPRAEYLPVLFAFPEASAILGLDLASLPGRMESKLLARKTKQPVASATFELLGDAARSARKDGLIISTAVSNAGQHLGYAAGIVRVEDVFREAAFRADAVELDLLVFDQANEPPKLIYSALDEPAKPADPAALANSPDVLRLTVDVASRPWELVLVPRGQFTSHRVGHARQWALWGGSGATLLLLAAVGITQRSRRMTAHMQASSALAEQRLSNIIDGTQAGTWELHFPSGQRFINTRWADMLGYSPAELEPMDLKQWARLCHPDDLLRSDASLASLRRGESESYDCELRLRHKLGHWVWVLARGGLVSHELQKADSDWVVGTHQDVSEKKQQDAQLLAAKEAAESASRAKSDFLATMSHEIRTPMNGILGMLKLLEHTELSPRQLDYTQKAQSATLALLGLINDILDFSKIEAGKMALDVHPFVLGDMMRDLSVIVSANLGAKDLEVLFAIDPRIPQRLMGDAMRLRQVLLNLSGNAIKFTQEGEVLISLRLLSQTATTADLEFSVRDTGIGIASDKLASIFESFSQAETSTTRRFGGSGLGLSICKRIIALMGGELQVDSSLGQGSRFHFSARFDIEPTPESAPALDEIHEQRVLIVDDNALAREVLQEMTKAMGWQSVCVDSGEAALRHLQEPAASAYQIILMDWRMPNLDGWETTKQIRQLKAGDQAPVIIMVSVHGREVLAEKSKHETRLLDGYLVKPVTASMLYDAVLMATFERSGKLPLKQGAVSTRQLEGLRLLVVEDNALNQQVAKELLGNNGAEVEIAGNGLDGVAQALAARPPFDAILMDLQMPDIDGFEATKRIRAAAGITAPPIIAMTANAMDSDRAACLAAGMVDHLGKPVDCDDLIRAVLRHTQRKGRSRALAWSASSPQPSGGDQVIDIELAIQRLGGNRAFYAKVLASFRADAMSHLAQCRQALAEGRLADAQLNLHTMRGIAGTAGASALQQTLANAEAMLRSNDGVGLASEAAGVARFMLDMETQLAHTLGQIDNVLASAAGQPPATAKFENLAAKAPEVLLQQLRALLIGQDFIPSEAMSELEQAMAPMNCQAQLLLFRQQVDNIHTEDALTTLSELERICAVHAPKDEANHART
ncbi:response regulator [Roseateles oligotrophus]|uniref:histidine kinase n=1 Tax=Roseateles oligotrophus TaxID=1769250 RepID=A0ABT2YET7_9BURK|nr:response regulator [Roseateles oligotrophus]MCV2368564.1 response regulator [Roseateles oligotrophus]